MINVTKEGYYTCTVTDEPGLCKFDRTIYVSGDIMISTVREEGITCNGGADGLIEVTASGGNADNKFTYNWQKQVGGVWTNVDALVAPEIPLTNGNTVLVNVPAGSYRVQVTNVTDGCTKNSEDFVIENPEEVTYEKVEPKHIVRCNGDDSGEIEIRVTGGSGIYNLDYDEDGNTDFVSTDGKFKVTGLSAGTYQLRITDNNGCVANPALYEVTITEPDPLVLTVDEDKTYIGCETEGSGNITFSVSGGNLGADGNPQYKISVSNHADRYISLENDPQTYSGLDEGTYTVFVQDMLASEPAECTTVREDVVLSHIKIEGDEIPNACAVTSANVGAIRNISITGTSSNWSWAWDEVNGDPVTDNTQLDQENLPVGEYILVVTDVDKATGEGLKGCEVRKTFSIGTSTELSITGVAVPISCFGAGDGKISGINITGTTNYSYTWSGPGTLDQTRIDGQDNLEAGTYALYVEDLDNGCQVTQTFEITEPAGITFELEEVIESCSPYRRGINLINLTGGSGSYNFRWTGPGGEVTSSQNLTGLTKGGVYEVVVNDYSCNITKSIAIAEEVEITTDVTKLKCKGDATGIIAVPEITGGSGNFSYVWTKDGANYKSGTDISDIDISGLTAGVYELTITDNGINDAGGACTYVVTETLAEPELIEVTGDVSHITCNGAQNGAINIQASGGTEPYSYKWTTVNGSVTTKLHKTRLLYQEEPIQLW